MRHICQKHIKKGRFILLIKKDVSNTEFKILENDFKKIIEKIG